MYRTILVGLLFVCTTVLATDVRKCSGSRPFPLFVDVKDCEVPPCNVVKGTNAEMAVHFVLPKNVKALNAQVRATTLGITVPYELPPEISNVCSNLLHGAYCPLYTTEDVEYNFLFPIDNSFPEISVKVEVSLVDEEKESVACFVCDVKVRKGNSGGSL